MTDGQTAILPLLPRAVLQRTYPSSKLLLYLPPTYLTFVYVCAYVNVCIPSSSSSSLRFERRRPPLFFLDVHRLILPNNSVKSSPYTRTYNAIYVACTQETTHTVVPPLPPIPY